MGYAALIIRNEKFLQFLQFNFVDFRHDST